MRTRTNMNDDWLFHYGELKVRPHEIARKAYSLGGLTASLPEEKQKRLPISPGGSHFLRLIAQGDEERGLRNLCGTDLDSEMDDTWRKIDLPHDWKMDLPYENDRETLMSGSKQTGWHITGRDLELTENLKGKSSFFGSKESCGWPMSGLTVPISDMQTADTPALISTYPGWFTLMMKVRTRFL